MNDAVYFCSLFYLFLIFLGFKKDLLRLVQDCSPRVAMLLAIPSIRFLNPPGYKNLLKFTSASVTSVKLIIFDFDGTIADSFAAIVAIANRLAAEYGYPRVNPEDVKRLQNLTSREIVRQSKVPLVQLPFLLLRIRRELNQEIHQLRVFPGLVDALLTLKQQGYRLGIVTSNSEANVRAFLAAQNLVYLFDFVDTGLTLFGKHRVIRRLLKRHRLDPAITLYVGDETRDVEAARKIPIPVIAVSWGFSSRQILAAQQPDAIIDHPEQLVPAIAKFGR
jgi:phosphoglycolate phosphatase-like HAD superfamily hydrolase